MTRRPKHRNALLRSETRTAYLCLIPSIIGLIFLTYIPLMEVFGLSFFSWKGNGFTGFKFVGFNNYIRLLTTDPYFKQSVLVGLLPVPSNDTFHTFGLLFISSKVSASTDSDRIAFLQNCLKLFACVLSAAFTSTGISSFSFSKIKSTSALLPERQKNASMSCDFNSVCT